MNRICSLSFSENQKDRIKLDKCYKFRVYPRGVGNFRLNGNAKVFIFTTEFIIIIPYITVLSFSFLIYDRLIQCFFHMCNDRKKTSLIFTHDLINTYQPNDVITLADMAGC